MLGSLCFDMEDISVATISFNEEGLLPAFFAAIKGIKDVVVVDYGSTDNTVKLAKELGARVYELENQSEIPTEEDRENFKKKYGFDPTFNTTDKIRSSGANISAAVGLAINDWVFSPTLDEIVIWDLEEVKKLLPFHDQIYCDFIHSPTTHFEICKLFRKSKCRWVGRVHEVVVGSTERFVTDKMKIEHHQVPKPYRSDYLPMMEYAFLKDGDARTEFYLAREYYYHKEYEKAIQFYLNYLTRATWMPEIAEAYLQIARSYWFMNKGEEARKYCMLAIQVNPNYREAFLQMAEMSFEKQAKKWREFAPLADNSDVLFINQF